MSLLSVKNLALGYDGQTILRDLNFEVQEGQYLCIVGENGSGKTTLMKTLLGLTEPMAGEISTGEGLSRKEIGYLPQQTVVQKDFPASVEEIVLSGCQSRGSWHPFIPGRKSSWRSRIWSGWALRICGGGATAIFPEDSSRECCWREHFVPRASSCFWMNRCRAWIRR